MSVEVTGDAAATDPLQTVADALEKAAHAASDTAVSAQVAVQESLPGVSRFVAKVVYTTCYSISYGVVFPAAWIAKSVPSDNAVVNGLSEGARAAIDAVDEMKSRRTASPLIVPPSDQS